MKKASLFTMACAVAALAYGVAGTAAQATTIDFSTPASISATGGIFSLTDGTFSLTGDYTASPLVYFTSYSLTDLVAKVGTSTVFTGASGAFTLDGITSTFGATASSGSTFDVGAFSIPVGPSVYGSATYPTPTGPAGGGVAPEASSLIGLGALMLAGVSLFAYKKRTGSLSF
jgi:hypothetical protein